MVTKQRLQQIIDESSLKKSAIWPTCCPWSLATSGEILAMAQELHDIKTKEEARVKAVVEELTNDTVIQPDSEGLRVPDVLHGGQGGSTS